MADNKKIYTIQINGIEQSIKAVDALSDSLQFLDKKIKEMESRSVSVTSNSNGNNTKNLQTEDAVLKSIQKTEQQIADARREEYQQLLADKDLLKETKDLAEQRAAAERLAANNYANTMKGLKQELSDIKKVMQTTELGGEEFNDLTKRAGELTNKLKELEVSYGQFGRNVGNYPGTMAKGFSKLQIEVNGSVREFDNARQALKELTNERNTLKLMGQDFGDLDTVVKTLKSDIKDMEMSSKVMDNLLDSMQGIIAIGQSAAGISALFGIDNDKIEESIQKLVALQNAAKGLETVFQQFKAGEGIAGWFAKGNQAIKNFTDRLFGLQKTVKTTDTTIKATNATIASTGTAGKTAATGLGTASVAANTAAGSFSLATAAATALRVALSALGIGLIIGAISALVEGISTLIDKQKEAKKYQEDLNKAADDGVKEYAKAKIELTTLKRRLDSFNGSQKEEKKLVEELNAKNKGRLGQYKSIKEYQDALIKKGEAYAEVLKLEAENQALLNVYTDMYVKLMHARDLAAKGPDFWDEAAEWLPWNWGGKSAQDKLNQNVDDILAQLDKVFNKIDSNNKRISELSKDYKIFADAPEIEKEGKKTADAIEKIEQEIYKIKIDAMKAGLVKTLAQLELERNKRIAEAKKTGKLVQEQIENINKSFQEKVIEARIQYHAELLKEEKNYYDKLKKVQEQTYQSELDYSKKRNELLLDNKINGGNGKAPQAITDMQGHPFENISKLTIDYNSSDVRKYFDKYNKDVVKAYINTKNTVDYLNKALAGVNEHYEELDAEGKRIYDKYSKKLLEASAQLEQIEEEYEGIGEFVQNTIKIVSEKLSEAYALRTQARKEYYDKILEYTKEASDKELKIEKDKLDAELKMNEDAEEERHRLATSRIYDASGLSQDVQTRYSKPRSYYKAYKESFDSGELEGMSTNDIGFVFSKYREAMDEWLDDLDKGLKEGRYTWEEYNEIVNSEAIKAYQKARDEYKNFLSLYNEMSDSDKAKKEEELKELIQNLNNAYVGYLERIRVEQETHNNKMRVMQNTFNLNTEQAEKDSLNRRQAAMAEYYSNLISENENALSSINSKIDSAEKVTPLGIINYSATKRELNELNKTVELVLNDIAIQKQQLLEKLKKGEISFGDYDALISQLKTIETQAQETGNNVKLKLSQLFSDTMQSISNIASQLGSALSGLIGALGDFADQEYENQLNELQDYIDEVEGKISELEDVYQDYASKVKETESAIATAQGDARDHLLDRYNAEIEAQRNAIREKKKAEKEKEKLEQRQKKLERDRFEQQKKVQTAQAIMSGALAVTNALSVQPIWVGIAMAAMVAAATAVEIATIKAQKYASGGVIEGKSHAQGGVKVLGGQAEVEGGEYITNKATTAKNVDLLDYINSKKKKISLEDMIEFYADGNGVRKTVSTVRTKFADGGVVPTLRNDINVSDRLIQSFEDYSNRPVQVAVVDIIDRTQQVNDVKVMAGLEV